MQLPTVWLFATVLDVDTQVTVGLVFMLVTVALALGEARWQVAHLREWKKEHEANDIAKEARIVALEARAGRAEERVDNVLILLTELRGDVKRLLERRGVA